jgi:hypothetical protein
LPFARCRFRCGADPRARTSSDFWVRPDGACRTTLTIIAGNSPQSASKGNVTRWLREIGDKLVTTRFGQSLTGGFCAMGEPNVAVCLRPGTELAFDYEIKVPAGLWRGSKKLGAKVARFRQVNASYRAAHHDALELPDGQLVFVTRLFEGQTATVIQLPAGMLRRWQSRTTTLNRLCQLRLSLSDRISVCCSRRGSRGGSE